VARTAASKAGPATGANGTTDARVRNTERRVGAAAVALVLEQGPAFLTIERVAERSGVSRSTIYRRWTDVDQLFLDAFDELTQLAPMEPTGALVPDLEAFAVAYARELEDQAFRGVLTFLMDASLRSKQHLRRYRAITRRRQQRAAGIVRRAIRAGELPSGVDAGEVADAVMAPLFHARVARHQTLADDDARHAVAGALARISL
jgi:AcrR family transcriptional regulator